MSAAQIGRTIRSPQVARASSQIRAAMQAAMHYQKGHQFSVTPPARSISHSALTSMSAREPLPDFLRQTTLLTPKECAIVVEAAQQSLALQTNLRPLAL